MRRLTVKLHLSPDKVQAIGTLAEQDHRIYFEYDPRFLHTSLELSPFKLPARPGLIEHTDLAFGPLPGLFDDSLPDGWGLLLMDRHLRQQGLEPASISPLERLAYLGCRTMGALTYHPPHEVERDDRLIDLHELGRHAEDVFEGDSAEILPHLLRAGGSPGGARPKILVGISGCRIITGENDLPPAFEHWIVKFSARKDAAHAGPVEYAYSLMARDAGIEIPPTRLFESRKGGSRRRYFGVKRFDRVEQNRRRHVQTFANLIHANFRIPSTDYVDLFKVARALTRNHQDLLKLFRLMVFNIAAHNRDDHAKNFAFMLDDRTGDWSLAPAYDLTHSTGPGGEHTMTILGEGRTPERSHCLSLAEQFGIKRREAVTIIDEVNSTTGRWSLFANQAGCAKSIITAVNRTISPV